MMDADSQYRLDGLSIVAAKKTQHLQTAIRKTSTRLQQLRKEKCGTLSGGADAKESFESEAGAHTLPMLRCIHSVA
jgi:hypothetical protein